MDDSIRAESPPYSDANLFQRLDHDYIESSPLRSGVGSPTNDTAPTTSYARLSQDENTGDDRADELRSVYSQKEEQSRSFPPSDTATRHSRGHRRTFLDWWQEVMSCALSLVALIALYITLHAYEDKPSPNWPTWLSLNTIVALCMVVLKSGILLVVANGIGQLKWTWFSKERPLTDLVTFDDASRGPGGAFKLLWRLRYHYLAASCGALLAVLALPVDPLAQQMLRYYDCSVTLTTEQASVPRTNSFYDYGGFHIGAAANSVSRGVQRSFLAGLFGAGYSVDFKCPTGSCAWTKHYSTFGYCSECHDISHLLRFRNVTYNGSLSDSEWGLETSLPEGGIKVEVPGQSPYYSTFAKIGHAPDSYQAQSGYVIDFVMAKQSAQLPSSGAYHPSLLHCDEPGNGLPWACNGYGAARCSLSPCVKTYAASMKAGVFSETLVETADNWSFDEESLQYAILDTQCITQDEHRSLQDLGYVIEEGERWLPYNVTTFLLSSDSTIPVNLSHTFPDSMLRRNCVYGFYFLLDESLNGWWTYSGEGSLFRGTVGGGSEYGDDGMYNGSQVAQAFYDYGYVSLEHVDTLLKNATESLTTYMRENSRPEFSEPALGSIDENKTCVDVRWAWLAYPAALLMFALFFLILLAIDSGSSAQAPVLWKSSPLALLYPGFIGTEDVKATGDTADDLDSIRGMEATAKKTIVQLQHPQHDIARLEVKDNVFSS